jgi:integrase
MRSKPYDFEGFVGDFKELLIQFVKMKQAMGFEYFTDADKLKRFSRFSLQHTVQNHALSKELADAWTQKRPNERDVNREQRINNLKQFAIFLNQLGYDAYIPVCREKINRHLHVPHIFTSEQLRGFFAVCDTIPPYPRSNKHLLLPPLYRLLYGCGLRISEAVSLKLEDVDLTQGLITIRGAKLDKDRLIPMSPSLTQCLKTYFAKSHAVSIPEDYFFHKKDKTPISCNTVYKDFRQLLWKSGISHGGKGRGPRLHDLRHTFAVHSMNQMVSQGIDLYCALPILSTYLGHASVEATEGYVRLAEEAYPGMLEDVNRICAYVFPTVHLP